VTARTAIRYEINDMVSVPRIDHQFFSSCRSFRGLPFSPNSKFICSHLEASWAHICRWVGTCIASTVDPTQPPHSRSCNKFRRSTFVESRQDNSSKRFVKLVEKSSPEHWNWLCNNFAGWRNLHHNIEID